MPQAATKLNLGCGEFKKPGYINVDFDSVSTPDIRHDLNVFPYPFEDDAFELVEADHVLEHLESPFRAMRELHRITRRGGAIVVRVPHFSRGFTHPEHRCGFDVTFPFYFQPSFKGGYQGVELELRGLRLSWFAQPYLKETVLPRPVHFLARLAGRVLDFLANRAPFFCSRAWCYLVGGFEEVEFRFVVVK